MDARRATLRRQVAKTRLLVHTLRDLGLITVGQVVANSVRRRRVEAVEREARRAEGPWRRVGRLVEVLRIDDGVRLRYEDAELEVVCLAADMVRTTWGPGPAPVPYALAASSLHPSGEVTVDERGGGVRLCTEALEVVVGADGTVEVGRPGRARRMLGAPERRGCGWRQRYTARAGERFSGLGEHTGGVALSGRYRLWNRDPGGSWGAGHGPLYLCVPVLLATHDDDECVLSFYENATHATVELPAPGEAGQVSVTFAGGVLREYLSIGSPPSLLDRYSALTGRPALPPRWALGYHQSRWGYKRDRDVEEVLDGYAALDVPLSAVHLDIDYMDGYRVFSVDSRRFPDLGALSERAGSAGVRIVTIVDPGVKADTRYDLYREGEERGYFCRDADGRTEIGVVWPGRAAFPDFTDPAVRDWWASQYGRLVDLGVSGIWHDMNEPTSISLAGDPTLPLATRHCFDGRGGDHGEGHNLYGLLMDRAGFEGLRKARPERRPFVLTRSGWAGVQRYAWSWTGDVESTWEGLRQQIATVVGLGLSGVAYSGPDVGGFSGIPDDELYLRWLQMAAFMPFFRTHSVLGAPPREPWRFAEPVRGAISAWIRLRYRLLPYLYTLAHEAAAHGSPLVRPLWWGGDRSTAGAGHDDAFLLGDALLVAPVTAPRTRTGSVALPSGDWAGWWAPDSAVAARGPGPLAVPAPLERIPVLVRAGSILPLDDGWAEPGGPCALAGDEALAYGGGSVRADHGPRLAALHCWPDGSGRAIGRMADDDGDGEGPGRRDTFVLDGAHPGGSPVLHWERRGDHPAPGRVRVVVHGWRVRGARADGATVAGSGGALVTGPFDALELELEEGPSS